MSRAPVKNDRWSLITCNLGNCPVDEPVKTDGWVDRVQSGQAAHDPQLDVVWVNVWYAWANGP